MNFTSSALVLLLSTVPATVATADVIFADWGTITATSAEFELNGTNSVTLVPGARTNTSLADFSFLPSGLNFPGDFYSEAVEASTVFLATELNATDTLDTPTVYSILFEKDVVDPTFHFYNLDNVQLFFGQTTQSNGAAANAVRTAGNTAFEVGGALVNAVPERAQNSGCEANDGTNGNGACGSLTFLGTYRSFLFAGTDTDKSLGGDGWAFTVSAAVVPVPASAWLMLTALGAGGAWSRTRRRRT